MPIAPEDHPGAVRQTWRAALCLAAIAVAALVAFHAAPGRTSPGLAGFHLALALAGFGVTRLAISAPEEPPPAATLMRIWARLAVWGVPALVVVSVAVLVAGVALLPPADLRNQAWTVLWTSLGRSGAELFRQGVHAAHPGGDLLLHGWIVGVAAQLAVGWSLFVIVMRRLRLSRWIVVAAAAGLAASLALDLFLQQQGLYLAAFYLLPPRAWPFLAGAVAALTGWPEGRVAGGRSRLLDGLAGFGALALPFYLWSWPFLALPGLLLARPLTLAETSGALAVAGVLAFVTHRWVETPVRRRLQDRPIRALVLGAVALAAAGGASGALLVLDRLPGRASAALLRDEAVLSRRPPLQAACHTEGAVLPGADRCTAPPGATADVVLWGNSHADHLSPAVLAWAEGRGFGVRQATRSGCLPLLRARAGLVNEGCISFNRAAVVEWGRERPDVILVGAAWTLFLNGPSGQSAQNLDAMLEELEYTLRALRAALGPGALIVLIGTTPDYGFAPAACHARRAFVGLDTERCDRSTPANARLAQRVDARLASLAAAKPGVVLYRPWTALCEGDRCRTRGAEGPWYSDTHHLTAAGGAAQTPALAEVLDARLPR